MVVITPERAASQGAAIVRRRGAPRWLRQLNWRLILALTLNVAAWVVIGVLIAKLV